MHPCLMQETRACPVSNLPYLLCLGHSIGLTLATSVPTIKYVKEEHACAGGQSQHCCWPSRALPGLACSCG